VCVEKHLLETKYTQLEKQVNKHRTWWRKITDEESSGSQKVGGIIPLGAILNGKGATGEQTTQKGRKHSTTSTNRETTCWLILEVIYNCASLKCLLIIFRSCVTATKHIHHTEVGTMVYIDFFK